MANEENTVEILNSERLNEFIQFAFDDLSDIARDNPVLFEELYYNRISDCDKFQSLIENSYTNTSNVLVLGNAGVGKTSLMHKLQITCNKEKNYTILMDYRNVVPKKINGFINEFLSKLEEYFDEINMPINTISTNGDIDSNFQAAYAHLDSIPKDNISKHLILFLDDFDYAENEWFDLLAYFLPFSNSDKVSLVLSIRPQLLTAINEYDDRFRHSYIRKAKKIELSPVSAANVISTRLAPIFQEIKNTNRLYGVIKDLFKRDSSLCQLAKRYGKSVEGLPRFEYPFTIKHNAFMQEITSGDLREIFSIAYESLKFVTENYDNLANQTEEGQTKKVIGRQGVIDIFTAEESDYKIINLHAFKSKKGNSLFYNILEGIKLHGIADDRFYVALNRLGHKNSKVDEAIDELSSKEHRFFVAKKEVPEKVKKHIVYCREYEPLSKLDKYLEMCDWDEYIEKFGPYGSSIEMSL